MFCSLFGDKVLLYSSAWPGLKLEAVFLVLPPEYWGNRVMPPHLAGLLAFPPPSLPIFFPSSFCVCLFVWGRIYTVFPRLVLNSHSCHSLSNTGITAMPSVPTCAGWSCLLGSGFLWPQLPEYRDDYCLILHVALPFFFLSPLSFIHWRQPLLFIYVSFWAILHIYKCIHFKGFIAPF